MKVLVMNPENENINKFSALDIEIILMMIEVLEFIEFCMQKIKTK